jgi:hypothetical protein
LVNSGKPFCEAEQTMTEPMVESFTQLQQKQKTETRAAQKTYHGL